MSRRLRPLRRATCIAVVSSLAAGAALSSCSTGSATLAHQACTQVEASLRLYGASQRVSDPSAAAHDRAVALADLRAALRPAALAASSDGQWQALAATLSETNRVPESDLVTALGAQCAAFSPSGQA